MYVHTYTRIKRKEIGKWVLREESCEDKMMMDSGN